MKKTGKRECPSLWDLSIKLKPNHTGKILVESTDKSIGLKQIHGNVLACTAIVASRLDGVLAGLFFEGIPGSDDRISRLNHRVFREMQISFENKIQLLKQLLPHSKLSKCVNMAQLVRNLTEVAKTGNKFAHGTSYLDLEYKPNKKVLTPYHLHYLGKMNHLDKQYFDRLTKIYSGAKKQLDEIWLKQIGAPAKRDN